MSARVAGEARPRRRCGRDVVEAAVPHGDREGRVGFGPNANRQITLAAGQELAKVDFRLVIHARVTGKVVGK